MSNLVPIDKKCGTIHKCTEIRDLITYCLKDSYPMPYTNQSIDDCAKNKIFSFMDGYYGYSHGGKGVDHVLWVEGGLRLGNLFDI